MRRTVTAGAAGLALAGLVGVGAAAAANGEGPAGRLAEVLSGLVSQGTITQEQADEVAEALTDAREEFHAEKEAARDEQRAKVEALLQDTLGMDMAEVREALRDGQTLLEIAGDNADQLAAGMAELLSQRLDDAVENGRITREQADEALARAAERTEAWLAGDLDRAGGLGLLLGRGAGHGRMGHGPGHGPRGMGGTDQVQPDDGSTDATSTSIRYVV